MDSNAAYVPAPVRTLQPGDVTQEGLTVLRVTPEVGGRLHVRFKGDDTLWRMNRDSIVWIRRERTPEELLRQELLDTLRYLLEERKARGAGVDSVARRIAELERVA